MQPKLERLDFGAAKTGKAGLWCSQSWKGWTLVQPKLERLDFGAAKAGKAGLGAAKAGMEYSDAKFPGISH